ncbi:MAG: putative lipid II flippase FtsW [Candidatus Rokuibacteriota bacterium]|nr:MAG: putative lipid II flippase FtsW [Candidatus Rokubacteria bacterium]
MPRRLVPDMWLFGAALVLVSIGVVMVYSASAILAADRFGDPHYFLKRQLFWALLGLGGLWAALAVDYRVLERVALPLLGVAALLLVLVLVPAFGQAINGTRRWLRLGGVSFQPVELAKLAFVIYLARFLSRRGEAVQGFWGGAVPPAVIGGVLAALVLRQPDLGNSLTLLALAFTLLFLAGARPRHLLLLAAPALPLLAVAVYLAPYRWRRILAFLNPESDPRGSGFQIIQSFLAIGSGGLLGRGLGGSKQKLFYLPEPHTDFVFAVIAEELGLIGGVTVIALFMVLIWRGLRAGLRAPDRFGAYLALGLTTMLATEALVNLGVVTGSLPTKGLPLPFVSFGGSALFMTLLSTGILLNISQHGAADAASRRRASRPRAADARSAARGALARPTPSGA